MAEAGDGMTTGREREAGGTKGVGTAGSDPHDRAMGGTDDGTAAGGTGTGGPRDARDLRRLGHPGAARHAAELFGEMRASTDREAKATERMMGRLSIGLGIGIDDIPADGTAIAVPLPGADSQAEAAGKEGTCEMGDTKATGGERLRMIDLFAGIGGIRMGFEQAFGDEVVNVFSSEWDRWAVRTYKENFGDEEVAGDITGIASGAIPSFDICLAGFPCQAFSAAGRRQGFDDNYKGRSRGTLFAEVVRICDHHRPKVIFCENVKGLVRHDRGRTFQVIKGAFEEIGYTVWAKVLNSHDFGVAQSRERIYIVCFRNDVAPDDFAFPVGDDDTVVLRDILEDAPIPARYYLSETYVRTLREHRARHEAAGHGFGYVIRDLDGPSGTIVCGGSGREGNLIIDHRPHDMTPTTRISGEINKEDIRKLTPREWARLQGFPDDFVLTEADTHLYKQFGNSVTVPVIRAIAERIRDVLAEAGEM